ncbi:MAG: phosphatase PAP2 family protein, partial [Phycisphaerae bacterium]|nr:phosphatase PAP2 family protein [Phycisphaerae bacterium]
MLPLLKPVKPATLFFMLASVGLIFAPGCATTASLNRLANDTVAELAANQAPAEAPRAAPALPRMQSSAELAALVIMAAGPDEADAPRIGLSMGQIIKDDIKALPSDLGKGFKDSYTPKNVAVLLIGAGLDYWAARSWDSEVEEHYQTHSSARERGDYGEVIGHPAIHFGLAGLAYLAAIHKGDKHTYEMSKTMIQALAVNGISTVALKAATNLDGPHEDKVRWPSGHTSSSFCAAAVLDKYYGPKVAIPAYLVAGYVGYARVADHEHLLSDVLYGALLGYIVGRSVAEGRMPEVAGFKILPY